MALVLVTGASGFVGRHLCRDLRQRGWAVRAAVRPGDGNKPPFPIDAVPLVDPLSPLAWMPLLAGVEAVVHLAGRAHVRASTEEYVLTNVRLTQVLTEACRQHRIRRFVFLSSVAVVGYGTPPSRRPPIPYDEDMACAPRDDYGRSKLEAERTVQALAGSAVEPVILRPPMVYGPGAPGNFARLLHLVQRLPVFPVPDPPNLRSMIFVQNLTDAIADCLAHPRAGGEVFFVADVEEISVANLILTLAQLMRRSVRLLPVPAAILRLGGRAIGRPDDVARLVNTLVVSTEKIQRRLSWVPPVRQRDGLMETVQVAG